MAVHSIPSRGGAFTRRLDAGSASSSTILFEKFFRGDIESHSPNTLVLSRCIVCRSAPPMGGDGGGTNDDASTVDGVGCLTGPVYRTQQLPRTRFRTGKVIVCNHARRT